MTYVDRQMEIVNAVSEALRLTDNWIRSLRRNDTLSPTEIILLAWRNMIIACDGDAPSTCRDLCHSVAVFKEEYHQFTRGVDGKVNPNGSPTGSFWSAIAKVQEIAMRSDKTYIEEIESIKELRSQKVSDDQIAFHIYGNRGKEGPFIRPNGTINKRLLDMAAESQEAQDKILRESGWPEQDGIIYPPWKAGHVSAKASEDQQRFKAFISLQDGPKQYEDPASIEDMLYDGCFIQQIEQGKHVDRQTILDMAAKIGVEAKDAPGQARKIVPNATPQPRVPDQMKQSDGPELPPDDMLRIQIEAIANGNPTFGAPEIVEDLRLSGVTATPKDVGYILRSINKDRKKQST